MNSIRNWKNIILTASSLVIAQGCTAASGERDVVGTHVDPLYYLSTNTWAPSSDIAVCWETPGYALEKGWVREAVHRTWEVESRIEFTGWGDCTPTTKAIRIHQEDNVVGGDLGRNPTTGSSATRLNFTFTYRDSGCASPSIRQKCIERDAIYAFGRALGFAPEQNRSDHPASCAPTPSDGTGDFTVGAFDMGSVMNVCNTTARDWLSPTDVQGVQQVYGPRRPISVASWGPTRLDVVWATYGGSVQTKSFDNAWVDLLTNLSGPVSGAPNLVSMYGNRLDMFVRGTDGALYTKSWTGTAWNGFWPLASEQIVGSPTAVSMYPGRIDLFVRRADNRLSPGETYVPSSNLLTKSWNGWAWSGYTNLGGNITGEPAVITRGGNKIDILARGRDGTLQYASWTGSTWTPFTTLGAETIRGTPSVVSMSPERLDVFVRGTDNRLYTKSLTAAGWSGYIPLGGTETFFGDPTAVSMGVDRIDVFVRGTDSSLRTLSWTGYGWTGFSNLGGVVTSTPTAIARSGSKIDVFYRSSAASLHTRSWDGVWSPDTELTPMYVR